MDIQEPSWFREWTEGLGESLQLKPEAPAEVVAAFEEFMQLLESGNRLPSDHPGD